MIFQLGVVYLVASMSVTSALPPCTCPKLLAPVCGSDGQTYNNECLLNCAQVSNRDLSVARQGRCADFRSMECICTMEWAPVYDSNGKMYPNKCSLQCAQRSKRESVQVAELPTGSVCACPFVYNPVCGTDGQTYDNTCSLDCALAEKLDLRVQHDGPCETNDNPCTCTREAKPVCGSDGDTYANPCMLQCAKETNQDLVLDHFGVCDNSVSVVDPPQCACTREMKPLCASDGNTYSNPCLFNCARESNGGLQISHVGPCDLGVNVLEDGENVPVTALGI